MTDLYKRITTSQYLAALRTLEQSIDGSDDRTWTADHIDLAVNQVVFHTLFFTDLYLGHGTQEFRSQPFHQDHTAFFQDYEELEDRRPGNFYNRAACREYLQFCMEKVRSVMDAETKESFAGPCGFSWRKFSRAELHVYNIRHIQHHAAQLGLRHQLLGGEPLKWVGEG